METDGIYSCTLDGDHALDLQKVDEMRIGVFSRFSTERAGLHHIDMSGLELDSIRGFLHESSRQVIN